MRVLLRSGAIVGLYLLLTVIFTRPLAGHFGESIPTEFIGDGRMYYWNLWWTSEALLHLHVNPFHTPLVGPPEGTDLSFHDLDFADGLLAMPVGAIFGWTAAYNWIVFTGYIASALGMYLLAWDWLRHEIGSDAPGCRAAAVVAGIAYSFTTFSSGYLRTGQPWYISREWLPLYALFLLRSWRERSLWNPILGGLCLAAAFFTTKYYFVYLGLLTALFAIAAPFLRRAAVRSFRSRSLGLSFGRVMLAALIGIALISPVLAAIVRQAGRIDPIAGPLDNALKFTADALAFWVPGRFHFLLGPLVTDWQARINPDETVEELVYLGLTTAALGLWAAWRRPRANFLWLMIAALFGLFALGPYLQVGGRVVIVAGHSIPLPYLWFMKIPLSSLHRIPARGAVIVDLALAVLAAAGFVGLAGRFHHSSQPGPYPGASLKTNHEDTRAPRPQRLLRELGVLAPSWLKPFRTSIVLAAVLIGTLIFLEHLPAPLTLEPIRTPAVYQIIAADPRPFALMELPLRDDYLLSQTRMQYQVTHHKAIFYGWFSRQHLSPPFPRLMLYETLHQIKPLRDVVSVEGPGLNEHIAALRHYGIEYLVINKAFLTPAEAATLSEQIIPATFSKLPRLDDAETLAFRLPDESSGAFAEFGAGWSWLETGADVPAWRWIGERAGLTVYAPGNGCWLAQARAHTFRVNRRLEIRDSFGSAGIREVGIEWGEITWPILRLRAGANEITLTSLDGADRPVDFGFEDSRPLGVRFERLNFAPAECPAP